MIGAEMIRPQVSAVFDLFSEEVQFTQNGTTVALRFSIRGLRADDLFGSAAQGDRLGVVKAAQFDAMVGGKPQRFSRVTAQGNVFTVQEWRPAPAVGAPVFYRLVLRGGTQ